MSNTSRSKEHRAGLHKPVPFITCPLCVTAEQRAIAKAAAQRRYALTHGEGARIVHIAAVRSVIS